MFMLLEVEKITLVESLSWIRTNYGFAVGLDI